jgi:3-oxoadipate enol-lactonase
VPDAAIAGARLSYDTGGREDGPPLLLSHALGTNRRLWDAVQPVLSRDFRVVRYDTRGHGDSGSPAGQYSIDDLGQDALRVLDAAGIERAHVAGVSLGGLVAMWLAVHAPSRVGRIVLANTAARIGSREHWQERARQVRTDGLSAIASTAPPRWFTERFCLSHPEIVMACQDMLLACSLDGYIGCCAALRDADLRDDLARISAETLVVTGTFDPVCPPADARFLQDHIAGAYYLELDAAHFANVEQAEEFARTVVMFLNGTLGSCRA